MTRPATDAAGIYSLLRQLGCATGVATMTAVLQAKIQINFATLMRDAPVGADLPTQALDRAMFTAYSGCFRTMAIITVVALPGILLFRVRRPNPALPIAE